MKFRMLVFLWMLFIPSSIHAMTAVKSANAAEALTAEHRRALLDRLPAEVWCRVAQLVQNFRFLTRLGRVIILDQETYDRIIEALLIELEKLPTSADIDPLIMQHFSIVSTPVIHQKLEVACKNFMRKFSPAIIDALLLTPIDNLLLRKLAACNQVRQPNGEAAIVMHEDDLQALRTQIKKRLTIVKYKHGCAHESLNEILRPEIEFRQRNAEAFIASSAPTTICIFAVCLFFSLFADSPKKNLLLTVASGVILTFGYRYLKNRIINKIIPHLPVAPDRRDIVDMFERELEFLRTRLTLLKEMRAAAKKNV